jgi:acetoacetate decarboxylase
VVTIKGTPFDSPLYEIDEERGVECRNCKAIAVVFTLKKDPSELVPEGLKPTGNGVVWFAHYGFSTLGEFKEFVSLVQVEDEVGDRGYYMPYGYVTTDAALAASRELTGAPKKLARIELVQELDVVQGILERPAGKRLVTVTLKPTARALGKELVEAFLPKRTYLYSIRNLVLSRSAKGGVTQLTQLTKWYIDVDLHVDPRGESVLFTGPASVTYDSPSAIDPVHKLEVDTIISGAYLECDMKINVAEVLKELKV